MDDDQCSLPTPPLHSGGTYNVAMIGRTIYDCLQYKKSFDVHLKIDAIFIT
jgi:hypothetical protein